MISFLLHNDMFFILYAFDHMSLCFFDYLKVPTYDKHVHKLYSMSSSKYFYLSYMKILCNLFNACMELITFVLKDLQVDDVIFIFCEQAIFMNDL